MRLIQIDRKSFANSILFTSMMIFCSGCYQDVIDLDLTNIDRQIVIVGKINEGSSTNYIEVTRTGSLSKSQGFDPVIDADVTVSDQYGNTYTFDEQTPGIYSSTAMTGEEGGIYTMSVNTGGRIYSAISRMPHAIDLDTIYFHQISQYSESYSMTLSFTDRTGVSDYAMIKIFVGGVLHEVHFYKDTYNDGEKIVIDKFKDNFYRGSNLKIEVYSLDIPAYRYYTMLFEETGVSNEDIGDEIDYSDLVLSPNFNPTNNITNNALGYFSAQAVRTYRPVVQ